MNQDSSPNARLSTTRLARRKALLAGLGKGSALVAAASPLQALATGRIVAPNGGQCTISGNGSILVSQTANTVATPCGMLRPLAYITVTSNLASNSTALNDANNNALGNLPLGGVYEWSVLGDLRLVVKTVQGQGQGNNDRFDLVVWSAASRGGVLTTAAFTAALGAGSGLVHESLLYGLYAGTRTSPTPSVAAAEAATFAAAYLGAGAGVTAPSGRVSVPFDRTYVATAWTGTARSAAAAFFASIFA